MNSKFNADCSSQQTRGKSLPSVLFPFAGQKPGGSHISTFTLAKALREFYGIHSVVAAPAGTKVEAEALRFGLKVQPCLNVPLTSSPGLRELAFLPRRVAYLRTLGSNVVVHCNDVWNLRAWYAPSRLVGCPIVYHHRAFAKPTIANRVLIGGADKIISISDACCDDLRSIVKRDVVRITNPFDAISYFGGDELRQELLKQLPSSPKTTLIGFVANFQIRKRPEFFLDVAGSIAQLDSDARFVMFGSERDITVSDLRSRAAQHGIADRVIFPGFRSPPEANIAALDLLIAPAISEPFGRTLVEAVLVGTPYVATADAGHSEIYRRWRGGVLAPSEADYTSFALVCVDALRNPDNLRLTSEAKMQVMDEIDPRRHAAEVLEIYMQTAEN
ncbi:glycosyltransferase family 4 protein [Methylobacterium iners]|uniref:D-inositol-3-phosphate glycosyltransferase n=1 Tax=Methylobacterium iners TaxID=418707 RepID=A0ABQ4S8I7_9HYPH|nr:glycosyltransferase family 4 protein [Methylobacterium iners]GJD97980.1 D-inositol-3-phosphate glycosyltransferase [Methylobacterium iners]